MAKRRLNVLAITAGIVLVSLLLLLFIPGFADGLTTFVNNEPVYDVRCDVTLKNPLLADVEVTSFSCTSTLGNGFQCFNPLSITEFFAAQIGAFDEGFLEFKLGERGAREDFGLFEADSKQFSFDFNCVGADAYSVTVTAFDEDGNFLSDKKGTVTVP